MPKIAFIGRKGGAGKTTSGHMLAMGLRLKGFAAVLAITDNQIVGNNSGRPYAVTNARSPEILTRLLDRDLPATHFLVVDGGASWGGEFDEMLIEHVDLGITTFNEDANGLEIATQRMTLSPSILGLPTNWPTNHMVAKQADVHLDGLNKQFPGRILPPVLSIHASKMLLPSEFDASKFSTALRSACNKLADSILDRFPASREAMDEIRNAKQGA